MIHPFSPLPPLDKGKWERQVNAQTVSERKCSTALKIFQKIKITPSSPKIPEFIWMDGIIDMMKAIGIPSNIPKPNVEACISQNKGQTFIWQICDPVRWRTQKTMLKENHRFWTIKIF